MANPAILSKNSNYLAGNGQTGYDSGNIVINGKSGVGPEKQAVGSQQSATSLAATQDAYKAGLAPINDNSDEQATNVIEINQLTEDAEARDQWSIQLRTWGNYYARTSAVGDGSDAYAGLFSVSS